MYLDYMSLRPLIVLSMPGPDVYKHVRLVTPRNELLLLATLFLWDLNISY